jgi:hypothetical protein
MAPTLLGSLEFPPVPGTRVQHIAPSRKGESPLEEFT